MNEETLTLTNITKIAMKAKKYIEKIKPETIKINELDELYDCVTDIEFQIDDLRNNINKEKGQHDDRLL